MTLLAERELRVTAWPFLIAAPGLVWFSTLYLEPLGMTGPLRSKVLVAILATGAMLATELALTTGWLALARHRRDLRTNRASVIAYIAIAAIGALPFLAILGPIGPAQQEARATLWIFFILYQGPSMMVLAIIVQKVMTATTRFRQAQDIASHRLQQVVQMNQLLALAEDRVQRESFARVSDEVAEPLARISSTSTAMTDEEIASALEAVMDDHLRPLAHELHPVTVRLGLIAAVRALGPHHTITVDPAVQRLDSDGQLLDDDVRLQLYRWIRENLATTRASAITFTLKSRALVTTITTEALLLPLDGIHLAAGLVTTGAGSVTAPLRGQPTLPVLAVNPVDQSTRLRIDIWQALTVPLPRRLLLVVLLLAGALPGQVVVAVGVVNTTTLTVMLAWTLIPLGLTYAYIRLPSPSRDWQGGLRVIIEWSSIAFLAGISYAAITTSTVPLTTVGGVFDDILRAAIRFTVPGLALTISYGYATVAESMLTDVEGSLREEISQRDRILNEAAQMEAAVAEGLHRTVQGRVSAIIVMLRVHERHEALAYLDDLSVNVIPQLLRRLQPHEQPGDGLLVDVPPTLSLHVVQPVPDLPAEVLLDVRRVIGEAAVNARRHGGATRLEVEVRTEDGVLTLTCIDNGCTPTVASSPGLGSRVFDQVCIQRGGSWTLTAGATGHRLEFRCSLNTHPDGRADRSARLPDPQETPCVPVPLPSLPPQHS